MDLGINQRQTKYWQAVKSALSVMGHATNAQLLDYLRKDYPNLSATTVHRVTARMAQRGAIKTAPNATDGSTRYDINLTQHDHFQCLDCGTLVDTDIKNSLIPLLEKAIDGCQISGRLTINGICKKCKKE